MKKGNQQSFVNIGSSSLLMVFLVLGLVVFAILSLSTAKSDSAFAEKQAAHRSEYYEACNTAEDIVADVSRAMNGETVGTARSDIQEYLTSYRHDDIALTPGTDEESAAPILTFSVPINESQELSVELALDFTSRMIEDNVRRTKWQVVSTDEWESDDSVQLISID